MAVFPVAAHTFDFVRVYLSTRNLAAPGSGTWSNPVILFNGTADPSFVTASTFSAGALTDTEHSGILCLTANADQLTCLGDGSPATPVVIAVGGDQFASSDYWDMTQGAWTIGGNLYAAVTKNPSNIKPTSVIKSTDGGATWAYMDAANQPARSDAILLQRVDGKILFLVPIDTPSFGAAIYVFDTATDTWGPQTGFLLNFPLQNAGANAWSNGIFLWPNGDIGVVYDHDSSDAGVGCVYQLYSSGSWGSPVYFPGAQYAQAIMDPSNTFLHVLVYDTENDRASIVHYSTVTQAGTVTGDIATIPATVDPGNGDGVGHCSIQGDMLFVPRDDFADNDNAVWVAALPVTAFSKELLPVPPGEAGVITGASPGATGSGYVVNDTGTIDGGEPGYEATYTILSVNNNIIGSYSYGTPDLGTGYAPGDTGDINGGSTPATYQVLTVGVGGSVDTIALLNLGAGYSTGLKTTTTGTGIGSGLKVNVLSLINGVSSLQTNNHGGGYSVASGVGTTPGGSQPGVGSGLTINIFSVSGKTPSCAYMMFPNGYSLSGGPLSLACPVDGGTATIGVPYDKTLVVTGGTPPYTFEIIP